MINKNQHFTEPTLKKVILKSTRLHDLIKEASLGNLILYHPISLDDIESLERTVIGQGAFGDVYKIQWEDRPSALKALLYSEKTKPSYLREVSYLR